MKAVILNRFGGPEVLEWTEDLPAPVPGPGEVRIRIRAAGVNPVDWKIREGLLQGRLPHAFPLIPGWDAAGVVDAAGEGVDSPQVGDEVFAYCRKPVIQHGCYAESVVMAAEHVVRKPTSMNFEEASTVPLAGLTAYQSLVDAADLQAGHTVLIHAGAGGVGGFAIQIAKQLGAKVITTGRAEKHAYLYELGADLAIDYTKGDYREALRAAVPDGVDVAYDTVGGEVQITSADCVKPGGTLVSILAFQDAEGIMARGVEPKYVFVAPNGGQLARLAAWADEGKLNTRIARTWPLHEAAEAHEEIRTGRTMGKLCLSVE